MKRILVFILIASFATFSPTRSAYACEPGERLSTEADIPDMGQLPKDRQIAGVCWDPLGAVGANANAAKTYLKSLPRQTKEESKKCGTGPTDANIDALGDTFAKCAAKFFKAYQEAYHTTVVLTSAFRDDRIGANGLSGTSPNRCAGGVPGSNHSVGIAIDVWSPSLANSSHTQQMWAYARANPKFGVCFPHESADPPHMILAGGGGKEGGSCAAKGVSKPCDGLPFEATTPPPGQFNSGPTSSAAPTAAIANAMRSMFMPMPTPIAPTPAMPTAYNPYYTPPMPTPSASGTITIDTPPKQTAQPAIDLITALGGDDGKKAATTTGSTSSIALINALGNVAGLQPNGSKPIVSPTSSIAVASLTPNNTFTSGDLRSGQAQSPAYRNYNSTFIILEQLRQTLLGLLAILKPFGQHAPKTTSQPVIAYMD